MNAGGAIGAAYVVWDRLGGSCRFAMDHAFWDPNFSQQDIAELIEAHRAEIDVAGLKQEVINLRNLPQRSGAAETANCAEAL